jgi:hypothetical protein
MLSTHHKTARTHRTHIAATKPSLELFFTPCLALQIFTNAQAPTTSEVVHKIEQAMLDVGSIVENKDRNKGDCEVIGQ